MSNQPNFGLTRKVFRIDQRIHTTARGNVSLVELPQEETHFRAAYHDRGIVFSTPTSPGDDVHHPVAQSLFRQWSHLLLSTMTDKQFRWQLFGLNSTMECELGTKGMFCRFTFMELIGLQN